eukprot:g48099.t1
MLQKCNADSRAETGFDNLVLAGQAASAATVAGSIDTDAHLRATLNVYGNAIASAIGPPSTNARRHNDALIAAGTGTSLPVNVPYSEAKYFTAGALGNGAGAGDMAIKIKLNLGYVCGSSGQGWVGQTTPTQTDTTLKPIETAASGVCRSVRTA